MMDGTNHHISTTSDASNPYKFRIIIEFNNIVDLPVREWKAFGKALGSELGIKIDPVTFTKSQIMFGYKGSNVLSHTSGDPYDVSNCIKEASNNVSESFAKEVPLTTTKRRDMLDNPLDTFAYAFKTEQTNRSLSMFRMWKHGMDLGAPSEEVERLMTDLNYNFWEDPISDKRFDSYVAQMKDAYEKAGRK